jgi:hypothetical protein
MVNDGPESRSPECRLPCGRRKTFFEITSFYQDDKDLSSQVFKSGYAFSYAGKIRRPLEAGSQRQVPMSLRGAKSRVPRESNLSPSDGHSISATKARTTRIKAARGGASTTGV